ncbi:hypothetical protein [uncultured Bacteroides sp.]|uniref:hypothetical protein n=1 Tax=uncultured Bacteroides sp. TaxID=162156 RepID=UPI0025CF8ADC|nr:hypothetical protein [uncultured Bacteroides sp.]
MIRLIQKNLKGEKVVCKNSKCYVLGNLEWLKFTFVSLNLSFVMLNLSFDQIEFVYMTTTIDHGEYAEPAYRIQQTTDGNTGK